MSLSKVLSKQEIPENVVEHLRASKRINAKELVEQVELWNGNFAFPGMIDAIHEIAAGSMAQTIRKTSSNVFSEVKQIQVVMAAEAISYAYIQSK